MKQFGQETETKFGITGTFLKWIALFTMIVDHLGLVLRGHIPDSTYLAFRLIGRIAFPIFCFCIVEGFLHTKSFWKYFMRIGIFALLSEVPFDIMVGSSYLYLQHQNVLWTFLLLLLVLKGIQLVQQKLTLQWQAVAILGITAAGCVIAYFARTDYRYCGILMGVSFYLFRDRRWLKLLLAAVSLATLLQWTEVAGLAALVLIRFYDGRRAVIEKELPRYFFYVMYPLHLLILGLYQILLRAGI